MQSICVYYINNLKFWVEAKKTKTNFAFITHCENVRKLHKDAHTD